IDRYEYPNQEGVAPASMITYAMARAACEDEGKRLCRESEWDFACEGPLGLSFGYGDERDDGACNADKEVSPPRPEERWEARAVSRAVSRVDARARRGENPRCTTPFGVRDALGNLEEWVQADVPGFRAALRGGGYPARGPSCRTTRLMR